MLTNKECRQILASEITLGGIFDVMSPVFNITGAGDPETGTCRMILTLHVPDRDTGAPFEAVFNRVYPTPRTKQDLVNLTRAIVHHAMLHEADESLRVSGTIPFDPHR